MKRKILKRTLLGLLLASATGFFFTTDVIKFNNSIKKSTFPGSVPLTEVEKQMEEDIIEMASDRSCDTNAQCKTIKLRVSPRCGQYGPLLYSTKTVSKKELKKEINTFHDLYEENRGTSPHCFYFDMGWSDIIDLTPQTVCLKNECVSFPKSSDLMEYAVYADDSETINDLVEDGYDLSKYEDAITDVMHYRYVQKSKRCNTPCELDSKSLETLDTLLSLGAETKTFPTAMRTAAQIGDIDAMKLMMEYGADINQGDDQYSYGITPLMEAAHEGCIKSVEFILDNGVDVNVTDRIGKTALHYAAEDQHAFLVDPDDTQEDIDRVRGYFLVENGQGNIDTVKLLLEKGVDTTLLDKDGKTALDYAKDNVHVPELKDILSAQ